MADIETEFLFELRIEVAQILDMGATPFGDKRVIADLKGGSFEGPKLRGEVLPSSGDWLLTRPDGVTQLDVRANLRTDDGELIFMCYRGHRHGPAEVMKRLAAGEPVEPDEYYFRASPFFETGAAKYAWLNKACFVAKGHRLPSGPVFQVYEVL